MRSASAFGVAAVITTFRHSAENGVLARAASGALDHLAYLRVTNLARKLRLQLGIILPLPGLLVTAI